MTLKWRQSSKNYTERPNPQIRAIKKNSKTEAEAEFKKLQPRNHDTQMETKLQKLYRETESADQSNSRTSKTEAEAEVN